ncbi:hypothetical protein O181_071031 [Austropuccinia psidii MF-1]|uniref:Uncharacterized protein n=1 Tax=Austropuccinia psidii MF-1 TaxID=1389203 RepID=A0A9Q3EZY8_9BASI|nr:hypothetical protein [Austropuccinia psidii MF-1]
MCQIPKESPGNSHFFWTRIRIKYEYFKQKVLQSIKRQGLGNVAPNPPRSEELLGHPQEVHSGGGSGEIIQWMESAIIQTSNQKDKRIAQQKEGGKQGRIPSSFYQKASS